MTNTRRTKKRSSKRPLDPERLIWHIEAAVLKADFYDPMAGFLLRMTTESVRRRAAALLSPDDKICGSFVKRTSFG
jgi:hypothetical protein